MYSISTVLDGVLCPMATAEFSRVLTVVRQNRPNNRPGHWPKYLRVCLMFPDETS